MRSFRHFLVAFLMVWAFLSMGAQLAQAAEDDLLVLPPVEAPAYSGPSTLLPFGPSGKKDDEKKVSYPGVDVSSLVEEGQISGGAEGIVNVAKGIYRSARRLIGPVLVFLLAGLGIQLIIAQGQEEKVSSIGNNFFYILVGTGFLIFADFIASTFFLYEGGTSFASDQLALEETASTLTDQVMLLFTFLRYVMGGVALFYVVKSGSIILFNPEEENVTKQKDTFIYGFVGLILIMISKPLVEVAFNVETTGNQFALGEEFFVEQSIDVGGGIDLITNVTNLLLASMGGLFMFSLVVGGVMYALSAGNEERGQKATKIIIGSLMGLVIAFSAYTIVAEFSSAGQPVPTNRPEDVRRLIEPGLTIEGEDSTLVP